MAKVFVDITELATWQGKLTGVPRVMDELSRRFYSKKNTQLVQWTQGGYIYAPHPDERIITEPKSELSPRLHIRVVRRVVKKIPFMKRLVLRVQKSLLRNSREGKDTALYVEIQKDDLLLVLADWHGSDPSFVQYLIRAKARGVRLMQVVYDMLPVVTPQYSGHATQMLHNYGRQVYPLCDQLFAISENTKRDVQKWLKDNKLTVPVVTTFRLGDDFMKDKPVKPTIRLPKKYILCVGTIEARKNHTLLYYTYKLARSRGIKLPEVVVVGRLGWLSADIYEIITTDPDTKDKFIFMHSVGDNELAWLYQNCQFSIYTSFYEGWGLPIAESISYGKPVLASNTSSMPEIAGDLISYFSPSSSDECLAAISSLTNSGQLRSATQKISKYRSTSWDETFQQIYEHVTKE